MCMTLLLLPVAMTACSHTGGESRMNTPIACPSPTIAEDRRLVPLFRAVLQYRSQDRKDAVVPSEAHEGEYIGSGDGTATGDRLRGTVRWSLWAGNCVYPLVRKGQKIPDGLHLCTMNPAGFIETPDGARIRFDGRGYGLRSSESYRTSMTLAFGTEDARYAWLIKVLGVMEGEFDEKAGRATWEVYVPAPES
jgi:hypothetical protein